MLFKVFKILANTLYYICYFGESRGKKFYTIQNADFFFNFRVQLARLILYTWIGKVGKDQWNLEI